MFFRVVAVAFDQLLEIIEIAVDMAIQIHRHKARQLQKARIYLAHRTRIPGRYDGNRLFFEPFQRAFFRQLIDFRRIDACVDRTTNKCHAARRFFLIKHVQQAHGDENRNGRLADGDDMNVGAKGLHKGHVIVDAIIKVEITVA